MDPKNVTFAQLIEHLNEIEAVKPQVKKAAPHRSEIIFSTSKENEVVGFSNMALLAEWASAHKVSLSLLLDKLGGEATLTISLFDLYGGNL